MMKAMGLGVDFGKDDDLLKELGGDASGPQGATADDLMAELNLDDDDEDMTDEQLEAMLNGMVGPDAKT